MSGNESATTAFPPAAETGSAPRGGRRRAPRQRGPRRARGLGGALGVTLLGAVLPGTGLLWARRWSGLLLLLPCLAAAGWVGVQVHGGLDLRSLLDLAVDPDRLRRLAWVLPLVFLVWAVSVVATYRAVRPRELSRPRIALGAVLTGLLCLAVAAPTALGVRYSLVQADLVTTVFQNNTTATAPQDVTVADPWGGRSSVSVLLLGGDDGPGRTGVRTDTVILLRVDTRTGDTVMFSLPRNMMNAQFPAGTPLHDLYPDGFRGEGDPGSWMLNAIYGQVPALHPGIFGKATDNPGADAVKQAVEGSLGIPVDYYALVNLGGFRALVDAMGGVTVNINEQVAVQGDTSRGIPPDEYLQPGPDQHLNGYYALWFARGRYGSDDYHRMLRQRCMISALIDEADPVTLLRRYQALAEAGKQIVRTDIPAALLPAFVDLGWQTKEADVRSVAFINSDRFFSGDPDFAWLHAAVQKAISPKTGSPSKPGGGAGRDPDQGPKDPSGSDPTEGDGTGTAVGVKNSCAYTGP